MPQHELIRIGTIGGVESFAGAITQALGPRYPEFSAPSYFPDGTSMFEALASGEVDAVIGAGATTGDGFTIMAKLIGEPGSILYVLAEECLPFHCALLGRTGAKLGDVRKYLGGPASITQAASFIAKNLPAAVGEVCTDPLAAARLIAECDGSLALLGTPSMAERFSLQVFARNVDGGEVNGAWWVISSVPMFDPQPTTVVVTGRFLDDGSLGRLVNALTDVDFTLSSVFPMVGKRQLLEFDYVLRFRGSGVLEGVRKALAQFSNARLAGALRPRMVS